MKIGADVVMHVARLAELAINEQDTERLAAELEGIVAFVEQLGELDGHTSERPMVLGPEQLRLREDVVDQIAMTRTPTEMAPAMMDGFFTVPRVAGMTNE